MPSGVYIRPLKLCKIEGCNEEHFGKGLCEKHWKKQYYQDNREYIKKQTKKYHQEHREERLKYNKQYYSDNKERFIEIGKKYRENNIEKVKENMKQWEKLNPNYNKEWYQANKEYKLKCHKEWAQKNKEHLREYNKQYHKTPKGNASMKAKNHNRRTLLRGLTKETIQRVYEDNIKKYGTLTCCLCFKPIEFGDDSLEHLTPITRHGSNLYENLGIAHLNCNIRKQAMTLKEWFAKMKGELK